MGPIFLIVSFFAAVFALQNVEPQAASPIPVMAMQNDAGAEAFALGRKYLGEDVASQAGYYFDQALRQGHRLPEAHEALAYLNYRQNKLELGDIHLAQAGSGGEWAADARRERLAALKRLQGEPPAKPVPVISTPMVEDLTSPGAVLGAKGCLALISAPPGKGMRVARLLEAQGVQVDCLASEPGPQSKVTTIWYGDSATVIAKKLAARLPNVRLKRVTGLNNGIEVRLGR